MKGSLGSKDSGNRSPSQKARPWAWLSGGMGGVGGEGGGRGCRAQTGRGWGALIRVGLCLGNGVLWECPDICSRRRTFYGFWTT